MARDGKRNPESMNQKIMEIMFGKKMAAKQPSCWRQWPEPQRSIYSRMFSKRYVLVEQPMLKKLKAAVQKMSDDFDMQPVGHLTSSISEFFS